MNFCNRDIGRVEGETCWPRSPGSTSEEALEVGVVLPRALVGTPVHPGGALLVGLVAHGRAHVGVDGQRDLARAADPLGDAAQELALLALRAVRVQGADHVHRANALGLALKGKEGTASVCVR